MTSLLLLAVVIAMTSPTITDACPRACRCNSRATVFCNERGLTTVPEGIPPDTRQLLLQNNQIRNSPELDRRLSALAKLDRLVLDSNRLTSFPARLPPSLRVISLRLNDLKFVGKQSLRGLTRLVELHLDANNLTNAGLAPRALAQAGNLTELILSGNMLASLPAALPASLRVLRVKDNRIKHVPAEALQALTRLSELDLSGNRIADDAVDAGAWSFLKQLRSIDLSGNLLGEIPAGLPTNLSELRLAGNRIKYVYRSTSSAESRPSHGALQGFAGLRLLDLSRNQLRSVEAGAFGSLPADLLVELQGNPWRCDCNLQYLKRWLTQTTTVVTSGEANVQCATPSIFSEVTISGIDLDALKCSPGAFRFRAHDVTAHDVTVTYDAGDGDEPPYVAFSLMYGPMSCVNCAIPDRDVTVTSSSQQHAQRAVLWVGDYTIVPIRSRQPLTIGNLTPATRYVMCVLTSYQHPDRVPISQCDDVSTGALATSSSDDRASSSGGDDAVPVWLLCACGALGVVMVTAAVGAVVWKRRKSRSSRTARKSSAARRQYSAQLPFMVARHPAPALPPANPPRGGASKQPLMCEDVTKQEFDVTLMVRSDLSRINNNRSRSGDYNSESTSSGTMTSRCTPHDSANQHPAHAVNLISNFATPEPTSTYGFMT